MKSIYSIFSAILALCLCFSLAACSGGSSNEKEPEKQDAHSSQNEKETEEQEAHSSQTADAVSSDKAEEDGKDAAIGTMLDKPEKVLELEEFYVSVTYYSDNDETLTMEFALKDKEEPGILYISDGVLKLHENIYELSSSGDVVKYTKDVFAETFTKDEESSAASLQKEIETLKPLLQKVGYGFVELSSEAEVKYKKCEDVKISLTGEAYKYELYTGNELIGSICVDKKTGIFVKMTNPDGSDVMKVTAIETDVNIPAYK